MGNRGASMILKRLPIFPFKPVDCCPKKSNYECGEIWEQLPCSYQQTSFGFALCCPLNRVKQVKECSCKQCIIPEKMSASVPWQKEECWKKGVCVINERQSKPVKWMCIRINPLPMVLFPYSSFVTVPTGCGCGGDNLQSLCQN